MKYLHIIWIAFSGLSASAHSKHHAHVPPDSATTSAIAFDQINEDYRESVRPIFVRACFDCHSSSTRLPWYAWMPIAKQMIAGDVREARRHLDLSQDFPFVSHATPKEDLNAIRECVGEEEMPPLRYRMMHWSAALNPEERKTVEAWVNRSLTRLNAR